MARILAIDYGQKRTGIAVTDPLQIIANALETIPTNTLQDFLTKYTTTETVDKFVIGLPKNLNGTDTHATALVQKCIKQLQILFPSIPIVAVDERFTSKIATQTLLLSGASKKVRQQKGEIDKMSACIILQDYLNTIK